MKIYDEKKINILNEDDIDLEKGYLIDDRLVTHIPFKEGKPEKGHYEVVKEYDNGGKDVEWVIDEPGEPDIEEHDEYEDIQIYTPYTEQELTDIKKEKILIEIEQLKQTIASTDYQVLKYIEGCYTDEEFAEIKAHREMLRNLIGEKEQELSELD